MKHRIAEQSITVEASESWSGELMGYDFFIHKDRSKTQLSISHQFRGERDNLRLGLITFYPRSVAVLEKLAKDFGALLSGIALEMRAAGLDDLRTEHERLRDELDERVEQVIANIRTGRSA